MTTKKFIVKGMSCSACVNGIEKNIAKLNGVNNVKVSLMDENMIVNYDENILSYKDIIETVKKIGYSAYLPEDIKKQKSKRDKVLIRFLISLVLIIPLMYFSMGKMIGLPLPNDKINYIIQFVLAFIILIINKKFFINGTKAVINKFPNMDTLVALSAGASFIYSTIATIIFFINKSYMGHMFYESSAMVVTLVTLGKWLENKTKRKTSKEVDKLSKIIPKNVVKFVDNNEIQILTTEIKVNDVLILKAGDYIPVDGEIMEGSGFIDKSAITGESLAVESSLYDKVISGSILKSGYIKVKTEKANQDTVYSKIIEVVRNAGASKAPIQKFADKIAGIFVPIVTIISILTFIVWIIISKDIYKSFNFAISVLVISCPCALGLATPVAIMATSSKALSLGILYKDAEVIQKAENINSVLLDKTATITEGKPEVIFTEYFGDKSFIDKVAYAIESKSSHPLATCIKEFTNSYGYKCDNYEYLVGKGAIAIIDNKKYYLGNKKIFDKEYKDIENIQKKYEEKGATVVFLGDEEKLLAVFGIADTLKNDSKEAINALNAYGVETIMVTGDNIGVAKVISIEAGISEFEAEILPVGKADVVKKYQSKNKFVAMVGDGINDSPAIKTADVGIAIGSGTDIAIDSADVVLVSGSLKGVLDTILLSKKSNRIIKENLFWAFFYNVIAIPVSAGVLSFANIMLTPSIAALCMCLSSIFVVFNALRISGYKTFFNKEEIKTVKENNMKVIYVDGMMCAHCVKHVKDALLKLNGVSNVEVDLSSKKVEISSNKELEDKEINQAIEEAGYSIIK